jgi:hypothetical protein
MFEKQKSQFCIYGMENMNHSPPLVNSRWIKGVLGKTKARVNIRIRKYSILELRSPYETI